MPTGCKGFTSLFLQCAGHSPSQESEGNLSVAKVDVSMMLSSVSENNVVKKKTGTMAFQYPIYSEQLKPNWAIFPISS